jgi:multidrug efflux system outer membrane protein
MSKTLLILFSFISISACKSFHTNSVPLINIPKQFPSRSIEFKETCNLPCVPWWKKLHDPVLNRLILCGLKNNADIHIALGNLEQAQGELKQVQLSWLPTLKIMGGYSTNPALGIPGGFYGIWPYYMMNIAKQVTLGKQAQWSLYYYRAAMDGVRLTLIGQIATAYLTLLAQKEQLDILEDLNQEITRLIRLSKNDIKIGLSNELVLADILIDQQLIKAQISPVKHNIVVSENALLYLINENPGRLEIRNTFKQINFDGFKPGSIPANVLLNRPDLRMAEFAMKKAYEGVWTIYSNLFPALILDDFLGEAHLPHSRFEQAADAYLEAVIDPAVFARADAQKGVYNAEIASYIKTARDILRSVDNDFSANKYYKETYLGNLTAQRKYQEKYKLQTGLLQTGLISYKELLISKIILTNMKLATNQAKLDWGIVITKLYEDLGGGYKANLHDKSL